MEPRFFLTYGECRARFLRLAQRAEATLESHPLEARGPAGEALAIDVARLGPLGARRLLAIQSGTHGIEGFAGSAIQQDFLAAWRTRPAPPDDLAVLLVHAVNPWGMAWWRRQNESNVDLNRNFVDFSAPRPRRPDYAALHPLLCPASIDDSSERSFLREMYRLVAEKGLPWVAKVVTEGQYEAPDGLYYGGARPEVSNAIVRRIWRGHAGAAQEALLVDLHTGFGGFGECTLLSAHPQQSPEQRWIERAFAGFRIEVTEDSPDPATPRKHGQLAMGIRDEIPGVAFRSVTVEIGTYGDERMLQAERHEHWLHRHGERASAQGDAIAREHRECSCPDDDGWRERTLDHGRAVIAAGLRALGVGPIEADR